MAELKALIENRKEHVQYLTDVLLEPVLEEFSDIYQSVTSKPKILQEFQTELGKIPEWNHVMIGAAYERVKKRSGCKFLPDLLRAIFTTSVKCHLMTHGKMDAMSTIKFRVPTTEKFIHRLLIACAQDIWKQPYLFYHAVRTIERQYNRGKVEDIIRKQVEGTIRLCLPMEQIVGLIHDSIEEEASSQSVTETESSESEEESSVTETESSSEEDADSEDDELVSDIEIERIVVEDDDSATDADADSEDSYSETSEGIIVQENEEIVSDESPEPVESVPEPIEEPIAEPTVEPIVEPTVEPDVEPAKEPVLELAEHEQEKESEREKDVQYFDELVKALEDEPTTIIISDASPQRKSIEIYTSSDEETDEVDDAVPSQNTDSDRKVIPLKSLLINERKFHRPKMMSRGKRTDRVVDAFY